MTNRYFTIQCKPLLLSDYCFTFQFNCHECQFLVKYSGDGEKNEFRHHEFSCDQCGRIYNIESRLNNFVGIRISDMSKKIPKNSKP